MVTETSTFVQIQFIRPCLHFESVTHTNHTNEYIPYVIIAHTINDPYAMLSYQIILI